MNRELVRFVIGGAPKCATTSLFDHVTQHPEICGCHYKEPNFFDRHYDHGIEWYEGLYRPVASTRALGEATTWTLASPEAPPRILRHYPGMRFVFVLRDPVDRAYSHFLYFVSRSRVPVDLTFSRAIRDPEHRPWCIDHGFYWEHLKKYESFFPCEQILVLLMEDLRKDYPGSVRRVLEHVGVDPDIPLSLARKSNETTYVTRPLLHRVLYGMWTPAAAAAEKAGIGSMVKKPTERLRRAIRHRIFTRDKKAMPRMRPEDRAHLSELYAEPNRKLAEYLGRDLSHWT